MASTISTSSYLFNCSYAHPLAGTIQFQDSRVLEVAPLLSKDAPLLCGFFKPDSIPRGSEKSGIGQGGSPDFLAGARGIAKSQDPKRGRKIWGKADASQNRLFNHERYKWREISISIEQCVWRHFDDPWSCYLIRELGSIRGMINLELDFEFPGDLIFSYALWEVDKKEEQQDLEDFVLGGWRWFAEQLVPTMHARGVTIPIFDHEKQTGNRPLEQATIRFTMQDELMPALEKLKNEGFEREDPASSRDYKISVQQILKETPSFFEEGDVTENEPFLSSKKSNCLLM